MKLKVYLASRWEDREEIITYRDYLVKHAGIECTARWLTPAHPRLRNKVTNDRKQARLIGTRDLEDIVRADAMIVFSPRKAHGNGTGGRHVECGIAIGRGMPILLCGIPENVFHCNKGIRISPTVKGLVPRLKKLQKQLNKARVEADREPVGMVYDGYDDGCPPNMFGLQLW